MRVTTMSRTRTLTGLVVAGALLAALPACGGKTDEAARGAGLAPRTAIAYVSLNLDPAIAQKRNLLSIARRFPKASDKAKGEFDEAKADLINDIVRESGLNYEQDVKPWLGDEVALVVLPAEGGGSPQVVVLIQAKDEGKAKAALAKAAQSNTGGDPVQYAFVKDYAVVAGGEGEDPAKAKAAIDAITRQGSSQDGGLAKTKRFADDVDQLAGDRLVIGWVDVKAALAQAGGLGAIPGMSVPSQLKDAESVALDLHAEDDALVVQGVARSTGSKTASGAPKLTESLPGDAIAALTLFDVASIVTPALGFVAGAGGGGDPAAMFGQATGLDLQADVLSWMGGEAVLVAGAVPAGGAFPAFGLVVDPTDRAKAAAALPKLAAALARQGAPMSERTVAGAPAHVFAQELQPGIQPAMALFADRFVLASSPAFLEALAQGGSNSFGKTSSYESVVGSASSSKTSVQLVVRIDPIREAIERARGGRDARYEAETKPNLEPLDSFGFRAYEDGSYDRFELKLTFD